MVDLSLQRPDRGAFSPGLEGPAAIPARAGSPPAHLHQPSRPTFPVIQEMAKLQAKGETPGSQCQQTD
ncbi:MAG: hypothetical protein IT581_14365 [Verrucomicrobiales bacterium]|nr:hypothetical protein [Verrucomicrobiales bacterium]